jgi:pyruvate dehydrogenase E2 component (dihydrolipoamide acetyltransferase)
VDYTQITGTGPGGRIVAADIERIAAPGRLRIAGLRFAIERPRQSEIGNRKSAIPAEELPPIEITPGEAEVEEAPFRIKTQARRVTASKHVIPHFYITVPVDVTSLLERKDELKQKLGATITHVVMLACLRALKQHPAINRSYDRGRIIRWNGVHLGLAVDTEQGLTVAVLRNAQDLALPALVAQTNALVERARSGKLAPEERRHATFTITNLGMFEVEHFQPIINPPSGVTLAVASALPAAVVKDGGLRAGRVMRLTAACDHRIVDGATAARFMKDLKALLEEPQALLGQ